MYVAKIVNNGTAATAAAGGIALPANLTSYVSLGSNSLWIQDPVTLAVTNLDLVGTSGAGIAVSAAGTDANQVRSIEIGTLTQGGYFNKIW